MRKQASHRVSERVRLTQPFVVAARPLVVDGKTRQRLYFDKATPGFGLLVSAKTKSYFVQGAINGRTVRVKIGLHPEKSLDEARRASRKVRDAIGEGVNPIQQRRLAAAKGLTLAEAWELHASALRSKRAADETPGRYDDILQRHFADWLRRPLASLTRAEVRQRHQRIARDVATSKRARQRKAAFNDAGTTTANNSMRCFRAIYNRALRQHPELPANPCVNVDWFKLRKRRSAFHPGELREWHAQIMATPNALRRDVNLFLLYSGMRPAATFEMRWQDVDLDRRLLHVPRPKGGEDRAFDLPLSTELVAILERRQAENKVLFARSPFVFPSQTSASGHITEARDQAKKGAKHQVYDLRRTFVTIAESLDVSAYALKLLVNHKLPAADVTAGYMSVDVERLRAPMQAITDRIAGLVTAPPPEGGKVVDLGARRQRGAHEARA